MCGSWGKGSHIGSWGTLPARRGKRLAVGFRQRRRRNIARWPRTRGTSSPHLQETVMHRVIALCIVQELYSIIITGTVFHCIMYFRKINHLVPVAICIHPLMYGKLCRAQLWRQNSALKLRNCTCRSKKKTLCMPTSVYLSNKKMKLWKEAQQEVRLH